jgi:hypothetical protein
MTCFGGSPSGEIVKTGIIYIYEKTNIFLGTEERMGLYSSINRGIYGHMARAQGGGGIPSIFIYYV